MHIRREGQGGVDPGQCEVEPRGEEDVQGNLVVIVIMMKEGKNILEDIMRTCSMKLTSVLSIASIFQSLIWTRVSPTFRPALFSHSIKISPELYSLQANSIWTSQRNCVWITFSAGLNLTTLLTQSSTLPPSPILLELSIHFLINPNKNFAISAAEIKNIWAFGQLFFCLPGFPPLPDIKQESHLWTRLSPHFSFMPPLLNSQVTSGSLVSTRCRTWSDSFSVLLLWNRRNSSQHLGMQ